MVDWLGRKVKTDQMMTGFGAKPAEDLDIQAYFLFGKETVMGTHFAEKSIGFTRFKEITRIVSSTAMVSSTMIIEVLEAH